MEDNLRTIDSIKGRDAMQADAFYIRPAMVTAYRMELAQFVDMETIVSTVLSGLTSGSIKVPKDGVSDSFISSLVSRYTKQAVTELRKRLDTYDSGVKNETEFSKEVEESMLDTLRNSRLYSGVVGVTFECELSKRDSVEQNLKVACYTRGNITGGVEAVGDSGIKAMVCPSLELQRHEVVNVLVKLRAVKDDVETNIYAYKQSNGMSGALIFGTHNKATTVSLEDIGVVWGDIACFR